MKIIIFGLGSIGQRHAQNLRALRLGYQLIYADPKGFPADGSAAYFDWRIALREHADADAAIIASPTDRHLEQMIALSDLGIAFYCDKPLMTVAQYNVLNYARLSPRSCVGHQYRFWLSPERLAYWRKMRELEFFAHDDLIVKYGPTCMETMGSHSLDLALYVFGPAKQVMLETDGLYLRGYIAHESGQVSSYDLRIDGQADTSNWERPYIAAHSEWESNYSFVNMTNQAYLDAMEAWLAWLVGGERDPRTATLEDGLRVMEVMAQCKIVKGA